MDADGGGTICVDEMQAALGAMGVSVSTEEVWLVFKAHRLLYRSPLGLGVLKEKKKYAR